MKTLKIYLALLCLFLIACESDDVDKILETLVVIPDVTINVEAILALPAESDITSLVNFGQAAGQSAADFVTEVSLGNRFLLDQPEGLLDGDLFLYSKIDFFDEFEAPVSSGILGVFLDLVFPEQNIFVDDPTDSSAQLSSYWGYNVLDAESEEITYKYSIRCFIRRNEEIIGPYYIDPKIKIKPRVN